MKNRSAIILLFIANSISGVAQGISMIAIPWYFAREGLMGKFGLIYVLATIFSLVWSPYSGLLVDKYNRKHIFLVITTLSGILLLCMAGLGFYLEGLPWFLVGMVFMFTFFNYNVHYPNLYAFVQEISEPKYFGRITSAIEVQGQLTTMTAGAFAALLLEGTQAGWWNIFGLRISAPFDIKAWTIYEIFLMDGMTYVLAFCLIFLIRFKPIAKRKKEGGNLLKQMKVGFNFLKEQPSIFLFGIGSYSIFAGILVTTFYLSPVYVETHLRESGDVFATSNMWYAVGAVFAGMAIRKIFQGTNIPFSIILMTLGSACIFGVLAVTKNVILFYALLLLLGIFNAGTRVQRITYLFNHMPNQVYGRATSIFFLSNIFLRILFITFFTFMISLLPENVVFAFGILGVFLFLSAAVLIKYYHFFDKN